MPDIEEADLGFIPRPWQDEVFQTLKRFTVLVVHRRGGKTLLAILKLIDAAIFCERDNGHFGYIAPELKQAKGVAWEYLKTYATRVPGTIVNESELYVRFANGAKVRLFGADNPNSFRGFYFDGMVLDEVAEMPIGIWGPVLLPTLSDRHGWALFIGTVHGINLLSKLYFAALVNPEWSARKFTYLDTRALPDEEVELMRKDMTPNEFKQEMLCDFNVSDDDVLIPQEIVREAMDRKLDFAQYEYAPKILGVDIAWGGGDRCVIFRRQGLMSWEPEVYPGLPEKSFYGKVARVCDEWRPANVFIDITGGYGGEVLSRLSDAGYPVQGVKFSWKASEEKFQNLRAEMWFRMAEWVKGGAKLPNNNGLLEELSTLRYDNHNAANKFQLESKDDLKERIGLSPDMADALATTFAFPVYSDQQTIETGIRASRMGIAWVDSGNGQFNRASYNPFKRR